MSKQRVIVKAVMSGTSHGGVARPWIRESPAEAGLSDLATPTGLEPATSAVTGRRANQLRYGAS
jgi:hypothetical protein